MAGFRMHVGTSTLLGCGYAGVLALHYGVPTNTAIVCGALCGFGGMLPDLDSDFGVPLREVMSFAAATIPMFMVSRFEALGLGTDAMALSAVGMYLFVRFGVTTMIRKFTVHRGMFHSIPAMLIAGGLTFLLCGGSPVEVRYMKAGGVMAGFLSHLLLDEIYSIEFASGRWRTKKSFGTAMKLWGGSRGSNFAAYSKVAIVGMGILGDQSVMNRIAATNPEVAAHLTQLRDQIQAVGPNGLPQNGSDVARAALNYFTNSGQTAASSTAPTGWPQASASGWPQNAPGQQYSSGSSPPINNNQPSQNQWPTTPQSYNNSFNNGQPQSSTFENSYNTAQRPTGPFAQ